MNRSLASLLAIAAAALPSAAAAHVAVQSGPAAAGKTRIVTFEVGHGCEGADTASVRIEIPEAVGSVRAMPSPSASVEVERGADDRIVAVIWTRPDEVIAENDTNAYLFSLRLGVPDAPFATLYFPTIQTCKRGDGTTLSTEWVARPGEEGEPAPGLTILPAGVPGWNRFTVPVALDSLATWFADAEIVWRGNEAFSANPHTAAQIAATDGVGTLDSLAAGDQIWVKY